MNEPDRMAFAPPPFNADDALVQLKRQLRDLKLSERGKRFESKGLALVEMEIADGQLRAGIVKRPARTPEWSSRILKSSAEVRDFIALVKRHLSQWTLDE
jgi:hypothetical protein